MDERTRFFVCVIACVGGFALLLAIYGAFVGLMTHRDGRTGGTTLGLGAARAFARLAEGGLSDRTRAVLVGAIDGLIFGAVVGLVVGTLAGWQYPGEWRFLRPIVLVVVFLVCVASVLGVFAGVAALAGSRVVVGIFLGGIVAGLSGYALRGFDWLFVGGLLGAALGGLLVWLGTNRRAGSIQPDHVDHRTNGDEA